MLVATARLAPVGKLVRDPSRADGEVIYSQYAFMAQERKPLRLPLLLDHDRLRQVGVVTRIFRHNSLATGGRTGAIPGAQIISMHERSKPAPAVQPRHPPDGARLTRHGCGEVLAIR